MVSCSYTKRTVDLLINYQFTLENGDTLTGEDGDYIVQEYRLETTDNAANNEFFTQQSLDFIDFSETNPFSEVDRY